MRRSVMGLHHRRGAVAVMIAVMMPVVLGMAGLGVDLGLWQRETVRLQLAADAAAMGAARLLPAQTASASTLQAAALAEANAVTGGAHIGTLNQQPTVTRAANWSTVSVILSSKADSYLSQVLGIAAPTLSAGATAGAIAKPATACVLALSSTAAQAIAVNNMGSITATGCGIFSDSSSATAIYLNSGKLIAQSIGAVGTVAESNSGGNTMTPAGTSGAAAQANPFASLQAPTPGACSYNNASFTAWKATAYQFTQSANVFCGNTTIGGNSTTDTFQAGVYYVVNGNLTFSNAAVTQAQGVTFVLTGSSPGAFSWTNNSSTPASMSAPTTGTTAGILVWQTCPASGSAPANSMSGGSTMQVSGQFYAPCGALNLSNNAQFTAASGSAMGVVASTLSVVGSAGIAATPNTGSGSASAQIVLLQ
jgi:Flp pilus assembly protein TadG